MNLAPDRPDEGEVLRASPSISVVIPLYNHDRYIEATLASVLAQTVPVHEIIVIDDGSTDQSAQKVRQLCKEHTDIIFWSWPNQGAHHTLNAGIARASGEFVSVLNSDDLYAPDRFQACLAALQANTGVDVVMSVATFVNDLGAPVDNPWYDDALAFYREVKDIPTALLNANFLVSTSNVFIRRTALQRLGGFAPLRYTHDLDFFLRLDLAGLKVTFLDQPLLSYRLHASNTISENKGREDLERALVFALYLHRRWHGRQERPAMLQRWMEIFGRQDIIGMVEEALGLLHQQAAPELAGLGSPLATAMQDFLQGLGLDCAGQKGGEALLAQFASAREAFARKQEEANQFTRLQSDIVWLTEQRDAWIRSSKEGEEEIRKLKAAMTELQEGNTWLLAEKGRWEQASTDLQLGNKWLMAQRDAWEKAANTAKQDLMTCELALQGLSQRMLIRLLLRTRLVELNYAWKQVGTAAPSDSASP